ncbi:MAG: hypothetical protein GC155_09210 [Alphaproteobacteria bacterium]|nr:hypothetical protein [Alphaproteobacteria bacterium]
MKRLAGLLAVVLMLAACHAPPAKTAPNEAEGTLVVPPIIHDDQQPAQATPVRDETSCKATGGDWRPVCRLGKPFCVVTYKDAGKACSGASDCSGRCMAQGSPNMGEKTTGVCAANNEPCGCFQTVEGGVAQPGLCVD